MICISILLLISISINCETNQTNWCPLIQTNGTYNEIGTYHRFLNNQGKADSVMFNRAGDKWLFDVLRNGSDEYDIHLMYDTVKHTEEKGILYRFSIYHSYPVFLGRGVVRRDCAVRKKVKI